MDNFVYNFAVFILGTAVGSFLNVVIFRLENGGKIVNDRSKCRHCRHILAWYDLIPILSFILLRGKCRYCKRPISIQYPLVEIATGVLFLLIFNLQSSIFSKFSIFNLQFLASSFYLLFVGCSLIVIFVCDLKHYIIPDKVVYPAIGIALIYRLAEILNFGHWRLVEIWNLGSESLATFLNPFIAAVGTGAFFLSIVLLTRGKGMGGGDVKLGFLIGLVLAWPLVLVALLFSFTLGSFVGIFLVLVGKKKMKSTIPFGPFMVAGTLITLFWGREILRMYFSLLS